MKNSQIFVLVICLLVVSCSPVDSNSKLSIPGSQSTEAKLFKKSCSGCHGTPKPQVHSSEEWPNVVNRMQQHRIKKALTPLKDSEILQIIQYLQTHSAN